MKKKILLLLYLFSSLLVFSQPANDDCTGAISIGTLANPGPCGSGVINGAITSIAGTNVLATPENPYTTLTGCGMASPANSVWYTFVAPPLGFGVVINVANATFANPNIALWQGANCNVIAGLSCIVGAGGNATLNLMSGIISGQTYYIQISGNTGQSGTFTLNVNSYQDCSNCLDASSLTISPMPVNGSYQPGQTVHFCYHIDQYTQISNNWLHGIQLSFGGGWNAGSLVTYSQPNLLTWTCGTWDYYPAGVVSSAWGTVWPPGYYFDEDYDFFGNCFQDGDPGDNFGDGYSCNNCVINPNPTGWDFCWDLTVQTGCNPGMSLVVNVNTSGDGESGAWANVGCNSDGQTAFNALVACCPPNVASTSTCGNASTGTATATPIGSVGGYVYSWAPGGSSSQTATGLAAGAYVVTVTDANSCSSSASVTVLSDPVPTVNTVANFTPCAGTNVAVPAFTGSLAGTTYAWTNSNPLIGLAASGTGAIPSFTATNASGVPISSTITVTPTGAPPASCVGLPITFTITVTPAPTVSSAGPNQTVCGTTATLAGNAATVGTGVWTLVSGAGTITNPASAASGITALGAGANVFQWTITNPPCPASSSQVTITAGAPPTVSVAGPNQTLCGLTTTLAGNIAATGTGVWTLISGAGTITSPASPVSGVTALGAGANVFQWTISNPPCPASSSQVTITAGAVPTVANAGPNQTVCGVTATLAGNQAVLGTGTWTLISGSGTITNPALYNSGITALGVGANVFQWTIDLPPCPSTTSQVTITGVASPTVSVAGPNQTICGTTANMAGNIPAVGTGLWTLVSGSGTITNPASQITGITGLTSGANVFQWTISNPICPSSSSQVTITSVDNPTIANAGPNQNICGSIGTLAGNQATTGTGTWTLVSGAGTITNPALFNSGITALGMGANVFQWTITNLPCPASSSQVTITQGTPPTVSNSGPNQTICGFTATMAGNLPVTGTGLWTLVSGAGTITNPASEMTGITALGVGANVFQWSISNLPCPPSTTQVTIIGGAVPTVADAGPAQTVCGTNATLAGNQAIAGTGTWSLVSGTGTIINPALFNSGITGLGAGANVFQWTINLLPCPPTTSQVTLTGVPVSTVSNAGINQTICSNSTTLSGNTAVVGTGSWSLVSGTGTITNTALPNSGITALGIGANVFQWTITNPPCLPSSSQVTITQVATPTVAAAGANQAVCISNPIATLAGNSALTGTGTWTLVSGTGNITNPALPNSGVTGLAVGANVFQWTITNPPCPATSSQVTITVNPLPVITVNSTTICSGQAATLTAGGGTTYIWSAGATSTGVNTATASPLSSTTYTVTGTLAGCTSTAVSTVSVNALPTAVISGGGGVCTGGAAPSVVITFTGTPPWNFTYSCSGINTSAVSAASPYLINNPNAGTYTIVSVSDANCTGTVSGSAAVTFYPIPSPSFTANPLDGCVPLCVVFTNTSTVASGSISNYVWDFGNGVTATQQSPNFCYTVQGTFSVSLTAVSNFGCTASVTMNNLITAYPYPTAAFTAPYATSIYNTPVHFTDHSLGASFWNWDFGDPSSASNTSNVQNPSHDYSAIGSYCVLLTVDNGHCIDTSENCLIIEPEFTFYIPNTFSPNGDGNNDEFYGKGEGIKTYEMWIYDRWGNNVFYGGSMLNRWDGTMHKHIVQEDVYVYVVKLTDFRNEMHKYIGNVTVVK